MAAILKHGSWGKKDPSSLTKWVEAILEAGAVFGKLTPEAQKAGRPGQEGPWPVLLTVWWAGSCSERIHNHLQTF
jgi:hypothetical protein